MFTLFSKPRVTQSIPAGASWRPRHHTSLVAAVGTAGREIIASSAIASHGVDADYIHLEFEHGSETAGPVNVKVGMIRLEILHVRESGRFWLGRDDMMKLLMTAGSKAATMTFDPDGIDSRPGLPAGDLDAGYTRAAARLRDLADEALATDDFQSIHSLKRAA